MRKPTLRPIRFAIKWSNPYTNPPEGMPRELMAITRLQESTRDIPAEITQALETVARPGTGWSLFVGIDQDARPRRRLSPQAKASIRRKSLERRIRRVAPLFADGIIADELAANPKYFNPVEDEST
jgi:hypothetical protein